MVGRGGVEPPTSRLSGVRSNHLSYRPGASSEAQASNKAVPSQTAFYGSARRSKACSGRCTSCDMHFPVMKGHEDGGNVLWNERRTSGASPAQYAQILRKEVIQPQVPLRLPCYDFIPVTAHSLGHCLLAVGACTSGTNDSHDVTGGVYKARERIHRGMLIRDY